MRLQIIITANVLHSSVRRTTSLCAYMCIPLLYVVSRRYTIMVSVSGCCMWCVLCLVFWLVSCAEGSFLYVGILDVAIMSLLLCGCCRVIVVVGLLFFYCKVSSSSSRYLHLSKSCAYDYIICDSSGSTFSYCALIF